MEEPAPPEEEHLNAIANHHPHDYADDFAG